MATATDTAKHSGTQRTTAPAKSGNRKAASSGGGARAITRSSNSKSPRTATSARKPAAGKSSSPRAAGAASAARTASRAGKRASRVGKATSGSGAAARAAATRSGAVTGRKGASAESSMPVKMAKSALVGLAGSVAIAAARRAASRRSHRTRVLGVVIPRELRPQNLAAALDVKKLRGRVEYRDLLKRIADAAEVIEARSDEVRTLSGQAKRLSRKLA